MSAGRSVFPSDAWRDDGVHWHAYVGGVADTSREHRAARLRATPDAVLWAPDDVAEWIDGKTIKHGENAPTWVTADKKWVTIGDADDLMHLHWENYVIASRGDSIYTDAYTRDGSICFFLEAVNDDKCNGH